MSQPTSRPSLWKIIVLAIAAVWILLRVGVIRAFREQNPAVINRVKTLNRRWFNPWMLRYAGHGWSYAARLEHRGRKSGALHATPLWVEPVAGGFLIPMPYGRNVDWARNLLHADAGVLQDHDVRYPVGNPRIVPTNTVEPELPRLIRLVAHLYGIRDFVRVDVLPSLTAEVPPPG